MNFINLPWKFYCSFIMASFTRASRACRSFAVVSFRSLSNSLDLFENDALEHIVFRMTWLLLLCVCSWYNRFYSNWIVRDERRKKDKLDESELGERGRQREKGSKERVGSGGKENHEEKRAGGKKRLNGGGGEEKEPNKRYVKTENIGRSEKKEDTKRGEKWIQCVAKSA